MALISTLDILLRGNNQSLNTAVDASVSKLGTFRNSVNAVSGVAATGFSKIGGVFKDLFKAYSAFKLVETVAEVGTLVAAIYKAGQRANEIKALSREAHILGLSFNFMSTAAALAGTDAETAGHSIQHMLRSVDELNQGGKEATETCQRLGIRMNDLKGLSTEDTFKRLADGLKGIENQGERVALAVKILGRAGAEMLPMLEKGSAGVAEMMERATTLGITLTDSQQQGIAAANAKWREMKVAMEGVYTQLASVLAPVWQAFAANVTPMLTNLVARIKEWQSQLVALGTVFEFLGKKWATLLEWFQVQGTFTLTSIGNDFADLFTRKIPSYFVALAEGLRAWTKGIGENIGNFIGAIWESISTGNKFNFKWESLENGFQVAMRNLRNVAPREMTALEKELKATMDRLDADLWRDFEKFLAGRAGGIANAQANAIANAVGVGNAKTNKAATQGSVEELAIRAGQNRDLWSVANQQLQETRGMRRDIMRLVGLTANGQPIGRARV